jgi:hypothetical protein
MPSHWLKKSCSYMWFTIWRACSLGVIAVEYFYRTRLREKA